MGVNEERNWRRYVMIRGPVGESRLDIHFAWLRQAVISGYADPRPTIEECKLKYSYKDWFPKDLEDALEEIVANIEKDIAVLERRFGGKKTATE